MNLLASLEDFDLLKRREREALLLAGIRTFGNLMDWLPKRYEDRRCFDDYPAQPTGDCVCLRGVVIDSSRKGFGGRSFFEATIEDHAGQGMSRVACRWFNMPFLNNVIATGQELILYGRPKNHGGRLVIDHPEFEIIGTRDAGIHVDRIVPIYKNISGIVQRRLRELIHASLQLIDCDGEQEPAFHSEFNDGPSVIDTYRQCHFPQHSDEAEQARRLFAQEEFFYQQLRILWKRKSQRVLKGRRLGEKTSLLKAFYQQLPFDLTAAQKRCVKEIIADMRDPAPMNRLLQGDVGSGKTFVAMCAMLMAIDSGCQCALMAPTQILAEQHYLTFQKWLAPIGVKVGLATSDKKEDLDCASIVIGTQALIFDQVFFRDLGLVVIDEQHRFGVAQRGSLIRRGVMPDVLVMTATPIPRTLTLTLYGDLDVSVLDELPKGRGAIISGVRVKPKVSDMTSFLKGELEKGRQVYLVYPLVEESESIKAASVIEEFPKWQRRLKGFEVGLLHGKLNAAEKEQIMDRFRTGKTEVLVSTSVIEVGVDVGNASVMVVFDAERFGLAQLHQLRGRIGRGEHKSYCILVTNGKSPDGVEKLNVLAQTRDGFKLAEHDLRMRGPGEVLGTNQSGAGSLRFSEYLTDVAFIRDCRARAQRLLDEDPDLDRYPFLREKVNEISDIELS